MSRVRLVPVSKTIEPTIVVPVAAHVFRRAHERIGPDGIADAESMLAAAREVSGEVVRGGPDSINADGGRHPVRMCSAMCEFRLNRGAGCGIYADMARRGRDLDGDPCEHDLVLIRSMEKVFVEGDGEKIREIAGKFSGAVIIQIQRMLEHIIADGAMIDVPIFDAKGQPIYNEEHLRNSSGEPAFDPQGNPIKRRWCMTRKIEHPLFGRFTQLLKETGLISLSEWQLTPKSSGAVGKTDGMILLEETSKGGGKKSMAIVTGNLAAAAQRMKEALAIAAERRMKDPAYLAARDSLPAAVAATPSSPAN